MRPIIIFWSLQLSPPHSPWVSCRPHPLCLARCLWLYNWGESPSLFVCSFIIDASGAMNLLPAMHWVIEDLWWRKKHMRWGRLKVISRMIEWSTAMFTLSCMSVLEFPHSSTCECLCLCLSSSISLKVNGKLVQTELLYIPSFWTPSQCKMISRYVLLLTLALLVVYMVSTFITLLWLACPFYGNLARFMGNYQVSSIVVRSPLSRC